MQLGLDDLCLRLKLVLDSCTGHPNRITAICEPGSNDLSQEDARSIDQRTILMIAATALASLAAREAGESNHALFPLERRKQAIDGAATRAGEAVLRRTVEPIVVRAGEGVRDDSPGAALDQRFGTDGDPLHAVIDYVDGTTLVAKGLPNALALGGLGREIRRTPDLKSFAALLPREAAERLPAWNSPRELAQAVTHELRRGESGRSHRNLSLLTHSRDASGSQEEWYDYLQVLVDEVIVPDPVAVEPPFILSRRFDLGPHIDGMVGIMGLVELVYAGLLLDLCDVDEVFSFRLVRSRDAKSLVSSSMADYLVEADEAQRARHANLSDTGRVYSSDEFVTPGTGVSAAMFAITPNEFLPLSFSGLEEACGLVALPNSVLLRINIVTADSAVA